MHSLIPRAELAQITQVARTIHNRLPRSVDFGDLVSNGYLGLRRARLRFDAARNVRFHTFAVQHIRGAILDGLRQQDWVPRRVREAGVSTPYFVTLEEQCMDKLHEFESIDARQWIKQMLHALPSRQRLVLQLYYLEGMSMKQVGQTLGLTESRVSQLHAASIRQLRRAA